MTDVGLTLLRADPESPPFDAFLLGGGVLICGAGGGEHVFERNRLLYGMGLVDILEQHRCGDAVFSNVGQSTLEALIAAKIRGRYWQGI